MNGELPPPLRYSSHKVKFPVQDLAAATCFNIAQSTGSNFDGCKLVCNRIKKKTRQLQNKWNLTDSETECAPQERGGIRVRKDLYPQRAKEGKDGRILLQPGGGLYQITDYTKRPQSPLQWAVNGLKQIRIEDTQQL